jgi:predicted RNase H-like nuclease (RuvC/YqgF family)
MKRLCCFSIVPLLAFLGVCQSLTELARREAERRRALTEAGIVAKVIDGSLLERKLAQGTVVLTEGVARPSPPRVPASKSAGSVASYRSRLRSLDAQIRRADEQLRLLRKRMVEDRWAPPKPGRVGRNNQSGNTQEELKWKVRELEDRLRQLKDERLEVYDRGRRAGFLPGELEGKGLVP